MEASPLTKTNPSPKGSDARESRYLDEEDDEEMEYVLATIETDAQVDAIETIETETDEPGPRRYRLSMHVDIPEHVAQDFFLTYVRNGRVNVEFHPADEDDVATV